MIDLRKCNPGDAVELRNGIRGVYVGPNTGTGRKDYPHLITLGNDSYKYRYRDSGRFMATGRNNELDVVNVVHQVDLRTCKPGDICVTRNGERRVYHSGGNPVPSYPHVVYNAQNECDGQTFYTDCGRYWASNHVRWDAEDPRDIVSIVPKADGIDLRDCHFGDLLQRRDGEQVVFQGPYGGARNAITYIRPNGERNSVWANTGRRHDDGKTSSADVVKIVCKHPQPKPRNWERTATVKAKVKALNRMRAKLPGVTITGITAK